MKRGLILSAMLWCVFTTAWQTEAQTQVQNQTRLTIEECYLLARANYPLVEQHELIDKTAAYNLANAAKGWLPQVTFSAQVSYQSNVTQLPFDAAQFGLTGVTIPTLSRDQYGAKVEVAQTVWDGGVVRAEREGLKAASGAESAAVEANLYALNQRVNGLFFGILLAEGQLAQIALMEADLATNHARVESYLRGGVAMQADVDAIRIEQLKAAQRKAAIQATDRAYREMLSRLIGQELGADTELVKPPRMSDGLRVAKPAGRNANEEFNYTKINGLQNAANKRPELEMFDAQIRSIQARERRLNAAITPRLGIFATGGYGRPGLNMLSDRFDTYYVVGARLSWNIGGLYTRRNDRRRVAADIRGVELRRDAFLLDTDLDVMQRNADIDRLREQLAHDDEIVELRGSVRRSSEAKMAGGTLSGTDLARDINAEQSARQDRVLHEMELLLAIYNLKFATNN